MPTVDLKRAALDALVAHLAAALAADARPLVQAIGVRRGWNRAPRSTSTAYVTVSAIGAPAIETHAPAIVAQVDDDEAGTTTVVRAVGEWTALVDVRLWANTEDPEQADAILAHALPVISTALRPDVNAGSSRLTLTPASYHSQPIAYRVQGAQDNDGPFDGLEGNFSDGYTLAVTASQIEVSTSPLADDIRATVQLLDAPLDDPAADGPSESTAPTLPNAYQFLLIADALETFGEDDTTDTFTQNADTAALTVTVDPGFFARTDPPDTHELRTWIWALEDARGNAVDLATGNVQVEVGALVDVATLPPAADGYVLWVGITDRLGRPSGTGFQRIAGLALIESPTLRIDSGGISSPVSLPSRSRGLRLITQSWTTNSTAMATDPGTGVPVAGETVSRSRAIGADTYVYVGVGTTVTGSAELSPLTFTPYVRVTALDSPS